MFISVQFKDKNMNFRGKLYDYEVSVAPKQGAIIRMLDENNNYVAHGTRVKVVEVKEKSNTSACKIRFLNSSLTEKSFSDK